jgi:hypothetical protein
VVVVVVVARRSYKGPQFDFGQKRKCIFEICFARLPDKREK